MSIEGFGIGIVMLQVVLNGGFEFADAFEDAATNAVLGPTVLIALWDSEFLHQRSAEWRARYCIIAIIET